MTRTHLVPTGTMVGAFATAGHPAAIPFEFNLITSITDLKSEQFKLRLFGRLAFAIDAYINNAIQSRLKEYREEIESAGEATWDNYQSFLSMISEIVERDASMREIGFDATPLAEEVQQLYAVRREIHAQTAALGNPGTYEEPSIVDFFLNPKLRADDAETSAKLTALAKDFAMNDDGVIDVEKMEVMTQTINQKRKAQKLRNLEWDRQRGKVAAMLFEHLMDVDVGLMESIDPFDRLPAKWQQRMIERTVNRYIPGVLEQAIDDYKITAVELTNWRLEARPLTKAMKLALEHPRMKTAAEI